jgi:putative transposase
MEPRQRRNPRLAGRDYSAAGVYYVTICTLNKHEVFGSVAGAAVQLSTIGNIVDQEWSRLAESFKHLRLDVHVVMPNHLHGIIVLQEPSEKRITLGNIVRHFKANTTSRVRRELGDPEACNWQRNYHDHIIRSTVDLDRIRRYIIENPANWDRDEYRRPPL